MKNILIIFLAFLSFLILMFFLVFIIDPYQENEFSLDLKYSMGGGYGLYKKLLKKLNNEPSILILGTSRSRIISQEIIDTKNQVLNMHVLYGNPISINEFFNSLNFKQISNIKKIYFLLDTHVFCGSNTINKELKDNFTKRLINQIHTFDLKKIRVSYKKLIINKFPKFTFDENYVPWFYVSNSGETIFVQDRTYNGGTHEGIHDPNFSIETMQFLNEIDKWTKINKKDIIYFTPPHTLNDFQGHLDNNYIREIILQRLNILEYIDGFYDFSLVQDLSNKNTFWEDSFHLNPRGYKHLFNNIKWKDYYVDKNNYLYTFSKQLLLHNFKYDFKSLLSADFVNKFSKDTTCKID